MTQDQTAMLTFGAIFVVFGGVWAFGYKAVSSAMQQMVTKYPSMKSGSTSPWAVRLGGWLFFLIGAALLISGVVSLLR